MEGVLADVGDALDVDAPPPLDGAGHPVVVVTPVLAMALAAYHRLVHFDHSDQRGSTERVVAHRFADAVAQVPSRLVGDSQGALELVGAHALLALAHEVDGEEPLTERQVRAVHDCVGRHAELVAATPATPKVVFSGDRGRPCRRTGGKPRPRASAGTPSSYGAPTTLCGACTSAARGVGEESVPGARAATHDPAPGEESGE